MDQKLAELEKGADELEWARDNTFGSDKVKIISEKAAALLKDVPSADDVEGVVAKARVLSIKGRVLCVEGTDNKEGVALLSKAVKMNPKCVSSWNALGHIHWSQGNLNAALDAYNGSLEASPTDLNALRCSALVLRSVGGKANIDEAVDRSKKALSAGFSDAQSWYTHGMVHLTKYFKATFNQDDLHTALKAFNLAEKNGNGHPDINMNRGQCQRYMMLWGEALASMKAALAADPEFEEAEASLRELTDFFDRLKSKWDSFAGYNEKTLAKLIKSLPSAPGTKSIRGSTVEIMPLTELKEREGCVLDKKCVAVRVLELVDDSSMPVVYLACDSNRTRCLIAAYGIDKKAISSGNEVIYGNPAYYTRTIPGADEWPCLVLIIDRLSAVTIGGRLLEKKQWSSMELNVTRKC
eukprot:TRINITY_DN5628_c0_g1_i3.p1 TRINITY_DN5628_c0_g1~~TRINITY_DN5628_c0_g1_i3.p1  ORF type:complete len:410 (+),score=156.82 TRINITY_DN5628_c0_g1_i3:100-1329(+)